MRVSVLMVCLAVAGCGSTTERGLELTYDRQDRLESAADLVREEARRAAAVGDTEGEARAQEQLAALQERIDRVESERSALLERAKKEEADRKALWTKLLSGGFVALQVLGSLLGKSAKAVV